MSPSRSNSILLLPTAFGTAHSWAACHLVLSRMLMRSQRFGPLPLGTGIASTELRQFQTGRREWSTLLPELGKYTGWRSNAKINRARIANILAVLRPIVCVLLVLSADSALGPGRLALAMDPHSSADTCHRIHGRFCSQRRFSALRSATPPVLMQAMVTAFWLRCSKTGKELCPASRSSIGSGGWKPPKSPVKRHRCLESSVWSQLGWVGRGLSRS